MAKQILPNCTRYEVAGKPGKNFHQKLTISDDSKMIIYLCTADLGLPNSASQSEIVKHDEFDHVLDTIFCAFWKESVHCVVG